MPQRLASVPDPRERVQLTVILPHGSVMIPSWLMACLLAMFLISSLALVLVWNESFQQTKEIRILQLHIQDLENVTVRSGAATRSDFIGWTDTATKQGSLKQKPTIRREPQ
jgi:hypothetical protein